MQICGKNGWRWMPGVAFLGVAVAVIAIWQINRVLAQITGIVSKTEPQVTQDGTAAHPYSDVSQCPVHTDLVFWPNGRLVPNIPPSISVCFVGNQPFENSAPERVELHDR